MQSTGGTALNLQDYLRAALERRRMLAATAAAGLAPGIRTAPIQYQLRTASIAAHAYQAMPLHKQRVASHTQFANCGWNPFPGVPPSNDPLACSKTHESGGQVVHWNAMAALYGSGSRLKRFEVELGSHPHQRTKC